MALQHPGAVWRMLITEADQSQAQVAKAIGTSAKHLNRILQGHGLPSPELTVAFARHMSESADDLWHMVCDYRLQQTLNGAKTDEA